MSAVSVVVSLGTDHHRFDRLVSWVEDWAVSMGSDVDLFVQRGTSRPPRFGTHVVMVSREEMLNRYRDADVVITQVGPGTILDVASVGRIPIVVPRRPDLGEHVDEHQIRFGRFIAGRGEAVLAEDEVAFRAAATAALEDPQHFRREPRSSAAAETALALAAVVDDVMSRPAGFIRWSRLRPLSRSSGQRRRTGRSLTTSSAVELPALVEVSPATGPSSISEKHSSLA
ncbi:glycosyltransferase [Amnibacterium setariae]|uniref:Glycosyl transferase family 28 n=1 Tax=Amnibacterium setariae TaxID=2306585 RepID=A0A3A1TU63_9MICO|nr:glycosyltransferase [Amnibacterium setariae]RIX26621.1 glycosyl transferase family 28 [Amnibacterium setariae]